MTEGEDMVVVEVCLSSRTRAPTSAYLIVTAWEPQFKVDPAAVLLEVMHEGGGLGERGPEKAKTLNYIVIVLTINCAAFRS